MKKYQFNIYYLLLLTLLSSATVCTVAANPNDPFAENAGESLNQDYFPSTTTSTNSGGAIETDTGTIEYFFNVPDTTPSMRTRLIGLIDNATASIDFALYSLTAPAIYDALIEAKNRGVALRFIGEGDNATGAGYVAMVNNNVNRQIRPATQTGIHHNKIFIIDGRYVWTGSTNMTNAQIDDDYNNSVLFDSPKMAAQFKLEFDQMFNGAFGSNKTDQLDYHEISLSGTKVEFYFSTQDIIHNKIIDHLRNAESSVYFLANSFTRSDIKSNLTIRQQAGVKVFGVFDVLGGGDASSQDEACALAGIPSKMDGIGGLQHEKVFIIDYDQPGKDPVVITGSYNWSSNASNNNDENIVIIHDQAIATAFYNRFIAVWNDGTWHPDLATEHRINP